MNQETKDKFNELFSHIMNAGDLINNIPVGQLTPVQREYLNNTKVLLTIAANSIRRISLEEKQNAES